MKADGLYSNGLTGKRKSCIFAKDGKLWIPAKLIPLDLFFYHGFHLLIVERQLFIRASDVALLYPEHTSRLKEMAEQNSLTL